MSNSMLPIGTIIAYGSTESPGDEWLICDGKEFPSEYSQIRKIIPSGRAPDLRGRTIIGSGKPNADSGSTDFPPGANFNAFDLGGAFDVALSEEEMPPHIHPLLAPEKHNNTPTEIFMGRGGYKWADSDSAGAYYTTEPGPLTKDRTGPPLVASQTGGIPTSKDSKTWTAKPHDNMQPYTVLTYLIFAGKPDS
ncbi:hypothetical protein [Pseudophaeobacter sp.]|uniref:hypothetical protein n=1 Tax=Pseudophaeobacter sp. TaxID=1971739 RepID=UPI003297E33F